MREKPIIQKFLASLLLVFIVISFIPKSYFHDIIALHDDDVISCEHPGNKAACVHPQGFNCSFNDLVVTAPYIPFTTTFSLLKPVIHSSFITACSAPVLARCFFGTEGRGPPAMAA